MLLCVCVCVRVVVIWPILKKVKFSVVLTLNEIHFAKKSTPEKVITKSYKIGGSSIHQKFSHRKRVSFMVLEIFVIARYKLILVLFNVIVTFVHLVLLRNVSNVCVCVCVCAVSYTHLTLPTTPYV